MWAYGERARRNDARNRHRLLLNLLIAMMGYEFDALKSKASLEYRLGFARRVLRAEQFSTRFFGALGAGALVQRLLRVGQLEHGSDGDYYFSFVEVGRNVEGRHQGMGEGEDIFADYSDSDDDDPLERSSFANTSSSPTSVRRRQRSRG